MKRTSLFISGLYSDMVGVTPRNIRHGQIKILTNRPFVLPHHGSVICCRETKASLTSICGPFKNPVSPHVLNGAFLILSYRVFAFFYFILFFFHFINIVIATTRPEGQL